MLTVIAHKGMYRFTKHSRTPGVMFNILNITRDRDQPVYTKREHHRPAPQGVDEKNKGGDVNASPTRDIHETVAGGNDATVSSSISGTIAAASNVPTVEAASDLSLLHESFYSDEKPYGYSFWCPGCKQEHVLPTQVGSKGWSFNGNLAKPSFIPSVKIDYGAGSICHLFVTGGELVYCADTTHEFSGQTIAMIPF